MRRLRMTIGDVEIAAELFDTPTTNALFDAAPFGSSASTLGDERYFQTAVRATREGDARDVVEAGELVD